MRFTTAPFMERFLRSFEWHDWFAWYPVNDPDGNQRSDVIWLETIQRKRVAVGPQGLTGNYEWRYRIKANSSIEGDHQ